MNQIWTTSKLRSPSPLSIGSEISDHSPLIQHILQSVNCVVAFCLVHTLSDVLGHSSRLQSLPVRFPGDCLIFSKASHSFLFLSMLPFLVLLPSDSFLALPCIGLHTCCRSFLSFDVLFPSAHVVTAFCRWWILSPYGRNLGVP